jgi:hypothetical protein
MSSTRWTRAAVESVDEQHVRRSVKPDRSSTLSTALLLLREEREDRPVGTTTTHRVAPLPEAIRPAKIIVAGHAAAILLRYQALVLGFALGRRGSELARVDVLLQFVWDVRMPQN